MPKKKDDHIIRKEEAENINVKLTEDEKKIEANDALAYSVEIQNLEERLKGVVQDFRGQIKEREAKFISARNAATTGYKFMTVQGVSVSDIKNRKTWFEFKGRRYIERDMSNDEYGRLTQGVLFDDKQKQEEPEKPINKDIQDVINDEKNKSKKHDHIADKPQNDLPI